MSRVIPVNLNEHGQQQAICPRYQNWLKRVAELHRSTGGTRRRARSRSKPVRGEPRLEAKKAHKLTSRAQVSKKKTTTNSIRHKPRRTTSLFVKIRDKSRNFGIRCRTSVALWRKWIVDGLRPTSATIDHSKSSNLKNVDITIVNKPDIKVKHLPKKTLVNEVIIEEDESAELDNTITIPLGPKQTPPHTETKIVVTPDDPLNVDQEDNVNKKATTPPKQEEVTEIITSKTISNPNLESAVSRKATRHDSFGFDIETIETSDDEDDNLHQPRVHSNAIKRVFNKLRLLF